MSRTGDPIVDFLIAQADWGSLDVEIDQGEELLQAERELREMDKWESLSKVYPS